jgi:hypothetical protein
MGRDALFHTALDGVRFDSPRPAIVPGSVIGAGVNWTEVDRFGKIVGDPRRVLIKAGETAARLGWTVGGVHCSSVSYGVGGWKQFDRFTAGLQISWDEYSQQFSLVASTPPIHGGSQMNAPEPARSVTDLSRTCLGRTSGNKA